ncbi:uncharacterized protein LACBIDRAFT_331854 [Laccaria bicolor S238N-H82]|uniref:Predicted protein n=1 Tax=Laccaria bicolor (strain S238N-H82 / ATCC MYA-4686) TaxID=486041 RepID=B0DQS3_LACBS|nr:uncharacterized protein LACBIDRAFT_331854 [Laccaria bicolor S238N-H82]EDR03082.1 predicted protein [Laccaria bicolor S238N-H82]|eukprot:XP_001886223.1 predicted protein [Laccaria bicolor S238N-H82]
MFRLRSNSNQHNCEPLTASPSHSRIPAMDDATFETVYDPASQDTQHSNQLKTFKPPKRVQRPKTCVEGILLYFKLMYKRRNMVRMPAISTESFPLFLNSVLACLFYIITFRRSAWYRLSAEFLQQRVEATFPLLKVAVQSAAQSGDFSAESMKYQMSQLGTRSSEEYYVDEWNAIEFTSLDDHWTHFLPQFNISGPRDVLSYAGVMLVMVSLIFSTILEVRPPLGVCIFATGMNYLMTSVAYVEKFGDLHYWTYQGFEWVNALSPRPSVGIWWEIELMVMPSVWHASHYMLLFLLLLSFKFFRFVSESHVWYYVAGLLYVFGMAHSQKSGLLRHKCSASAMSITPLTRATFIAANHVQVALSQKTMYELVEGEEGVKEVPIPESFKKSGIPQGYTVDPATVVASLAKSGITTEEQLPDGLLEGFKDVINASTNLNIIPTSKRAIEDASLAKDDAEEK